MSLIRFIECFTLLGFASLTLGGCALVQEFETPVALKPPPIEKRTAAPASRALGSLWSEDSPWNDIYSVSVARVVGDLVIVQLDESMKQSLKSRVEALYRDDTRPEPEPELDANGKPIAKKPAPAKDATVAVLRATIREVHPRGVYTIVAADRVRVGENEPYVYLEGQVRDRDIAADETVSSAAIQGIKFDVYTTSPQQLTAGNTP